MKLLNPLFNLPFLGLGVSKSVRECLRVSQGIQILLNAQIFKWIIWIDGSLNAYLLRALLCGDKKQDSSRMLGYAIGIAERGSPYGNAEPGEEFWRLVSLITLGKVVTIKTSRQLNLKFEFSLHSI